MPQYLLAVHSAEEDWTDSSPDKQRAVQQVAAFNDRLRESGSWVFVGGLHPPSTATTVDATGGGPLYTDGPFAETKEHLGGFWIIDVDDLDTALQWAVDASTACAGRVEIRPFAG